MDLPLWPQQLVRLSWHALQQILPSRWADGVIGIRKRVVESVVLSKTVERTGPELGVLIGDHTEPCVL